MAEYQFKVGDLVKYSERGRSSKSRDVWDAILEVTEVNSFRISARYISVPKMPYLLDAVRTLNSNGFELFKGSNDLQKTRVKWI